MRRLATAAIFSLAMMSGASAKIVTVPVDYSDSQGTPLHGFVVYDDVNSEKRPGVIVVHDWRGLTDYTHMRAEMLAKLGYVAFAADIYGHDISKDGVPAWSKEITIYKGDRALYRQRCHAAYDAFLKQPL